MALRLAAGFVFVLALTFCIGILGAVFGLKNDLVMAWIVAGPLIYWLSVALMVITVVMSLQSPERYGDVELFLYLSVAFSLIGYLGLGWVGGSFGGTVPLTLVAALLVGFGLGTTGQRHLRVAVASLLIIGVWYTDASIIQLFVAAMLMVTALVRAICVTKGMNGS